MSSKQKRIQSIMKQLYGIHEELFGQKYGIGLALDQASQFNKIIQEFREVIFVVRSCQEERETRENKKNFQRTPQRLKINQQIRQDLSRAEEILKEAARRVDNGNPDDHIKGNRAKILSNCYNLLQDAKQVEEGGTYMPPSHPTFIEIKQKLMEQKKMKRFGSSSEIDVEEQIAFDKFDQKDKEMDNILEDIIEGDRRVRGKMIEANKKIEEGHEKMNKAGKEMGKLTKRILKADSDLVEVLKNYQRPSQCCLNVTLAFMVIALIGVIISLIRGESV